MYKMQMPIDANTDAKNGRSKNHGINGTIWLSATKYKTNTNTKTMANASTNINTYANADARNARSNTIISRRQYG